jgi:acyl homoserine lactone synthase
MTTVAMGSSNQLSTSAMNLMHEFRHEVFVRRLGWSLPLVNGIERDQYDTPDAKYVVISESEGRVTACARLLPTTRSYMLPELFPQLLGSAQTPRADDIWELSRFATSVRETADRRVMSLAKPTLELLAVVCDYAREHKVKRLLLVTSIAIERLMLRAGIGAHRLAAPAMVDGNLCVALVIEVSPPAESTFSHSMAAHCELKSCA